MSLTFACHLVYEPWNKTENLRFHQLSNKIYSIEFLFFVLMQMERRGSANLQG